VDSHFAIFGVLNWNLWPKERSWIKFKIWDMTIKTWEHGLKNFRLRCATCHWKDLVKNFNFVMWNSWIKLIWKIYDPIKSHDSWLGNLGITFGNCKDFNHFDATFTTIKKCIYKEDGWWFISKYGSCKCNEYKTSLWIKSQFHLH
jgi:hypothetical protein